MNRKSNFAAAAAVVFAVLTILTASGVFGQNPSPTPTTMNPPPPPPLETILAEAEKQTDNYRETFRNLLADERKTFERFDKKGELKEQTVVESTFLVYQSSKDKNVTSELRNVVKVNDKLVPDSLKRSEKFLAELQKASTLESELKKIQEEGSRYDKTLEIGGLTLFEAIVLSDNLRPYFDFQFLGTENLGGSAVYVVGYRQTRKSPYVSLNSKDRATDGLSFDFRLNVPGALKNSDAFLRGKLWIDAKTFQIWREERELTLQTSLAPLVLLATTLDYQTSDYGILVPKRITLLSNEVKKQSERYTEVKDTRVSFDYSKFRKTEVDVKILDDDQ